MPDTNIPTTRALVAAPQMGLRPQNFAELERLAQWAANSGAFRNYNNKVADAFIAMQMGSELGLGPIQSLSSIAVINGNAGVYGDALIGLCWQSPHCEDIIEKLEGAGEDRVAVCTAKRRGASTANTRRSSVADARRAKLWQDNPTVTRTSKSGGSYEADAGVWYSYPERMLQMRARSWCLRDTFPDVLRGIGSAEELIDTFQGTTIDGTATDLPPAPPQSAPQSEPAQQPPPSQPAQPATAAADNGTADTAGKWKTGLEIALKTVASQDDLNLMINRDSFTGWRAKATPQQEEEIARMIATRRAELMAQAAAAAETAKATVAGRMLDNFDQGEAQRKADQPPLDEPPPVVMDPAAVLLTALSVPTTVEHLTALWMSRDFAGTLGMLGAPDHERVKSAYEARLATLAGSGA